jgi:hypothetical protein
MIKSFIVAICMPFYVIAQVGVGTTSPNASAILDVSSTSKGFLPPRLTFMQRQTISAPAQGLVIYCTDCGTHGELQVYNGSVWTNMVGGSHSVGIGQSAYGGKVAYIFQPGDPGYVVGEIHGLVAAVSDQSSGIRWHNGSNTVTGANGTAIGTGLSNTNTIISAQGATSTNYAAGLARAYLGGGYSDWYLPSKDELYKLWINRVAIGLVNGISGYYWSSSEADQNGAWYINFNTGTLNAFYNKYSTSSVRAIRSF